jgi:exonuclease III
MDQRGFKVFSWNATSLPVRDANHWKIRKLHNVLRDHIVCIQETKLSNVDMHALQMLFPQCLVLGTPATGAQGGVSGGLAVIVPTHLFGKNAVWTDIIEGYAGCVELPMLHLPLRIVCVYMRPGDERRILDCTAKYLKTKTPYLGTTVFLGDANAMRALLVLSGHLGST